MRGRVRLTLIPTKKSSLEKVGLVRSGLSKKNAITSQMIWGKTNNTHDLQQQWPQIHLIINIEQHSLCRRGKTQLTWCQSPPRSLLSCWIAVPISQAFHPRSLWVYTMWLCTQLDRVLEPRCRTYTEDGLIHLPGCYPGGLLVWSVGDHPKWDIVRELWRDI